MDLEVSEQEDDVPGGTLIKRHNGIGANPAALLPATAKSPGMFVIRKNVLLLFSKHFFLFVRQ